MSICSRCGGDIDFRYVDGRCIPIHLSGGCGGGVSYAPVKDYSGYSRSKESCCFSTSCPECGDDVYFIRHNGGSVWIDPPLGPPWYIHPCMDTNDSQKIAVSNADSRTKLIENSYLKQKNLENLIVGVVTETDVSTFKKYSILTFETGKNDKFVLLVANSAGFLIGKLVAYNSQKMTLVWIFGKGDSFRVLKEIEAPQIKPNEVNTDGMIPCPVCDKNIFLFELRNHIRNTHWYELPKAQTRGKQ
jgi:hypothetical protein